MASRVFFEPKPLASQERPYRSVRDAHAVGGQLVLQPVQRQVRRPSNLLQDEVAVRLEHRLAMPAHLARRYRAGRTMTLRPFHSRGDGNTEPSRNRPAALSGQNRRNHTLTKIYRQRSSHSMLASPPASILNHKFSQTGIPFRFS